MKKIMTAFVSVLRVLKENKQGFIVMKNLHTLWLALLLGISHNTLAGTELYFVHNDHLGTARVITNQNQNVVWQGEYSPFGEVEETSDQLEFRQRFPGQYSDDESGYFYNYYRDYDPSIGRYVQSDPIGLAGGLSTYGYALQNPTMYTDPNGLYVHLAGRAGWVAGGLLNAGVRHAIGISLSTLLVDAAWNVLHSEPLSKSDKATKARERKEYSRICKTPIPPTGDPCTDAKNNLDRLRQCLQLRENFSRKWFNDGEAGHMIEIQNTRTAISNTEDWIRDNCDEQCNE